jgi:hypothetical protein
MEEEVKEVESILAPYSVHVPYLSTRDDRNTHNEEKQKKETEMYRRGRVLRVNCVAILRDISRDSQVRIAQRIRIRCGLIQ